MSKITRFDRISKQKLQIMLFFKIYVIFNKFCYFWHFFCQILLFLSNFVIFSKLCYLFFFISAFFFLIFDTLCEKFCFFTNCVRYNNCCYFWLLLFLTNFVIFEKFWYVCNFFQVWQIEAKKIKIKITRIDHFLSFTHVFKNVFFFVFFAINFEIILNLSDHPDNQLSQITTNQNP